VNGVNLHYVVAGEGPVVLPQKLFRGDQIGGTETLGKATRTSPGARNRPGYLVENHRFRRSERVDSSGQDRAASMTLGGIADGGTCHPGLPIKT
jgi:hypothetical protein